MRHYFNSQDMKTANWAFSRRMDTGDVVRVWGSCAHFLWEMTLYPHIVLVFYNWRFSGGSAGKESAWNVGDLLWSQDWEDPLEKGTAIHFSILAWRIPWTTVHGVAESRTRLSNYAQTLVSASCYSIRRSSDRFFHCFYDQVTIFYTCVCVHV